jgi:hypothetical protein
MMNSGWLTAGLVLVPMAAALAEDKVTTGDELPKPGAEPAGVSLELRLKAPESVRLDLGGKTGAAFRKSVADAIRRGEEPPAAPKAELELQIVNTGKTPMDVQFDGDPNVVTLHLKGKGALTAGTALGFTTDFRGPRTVTIPPGESHTINLNRLGHGFRLDEKRSYWTEPGDYELAASYRTGVKPPPAGAKAGDDGFAPVTLSSKAVAIKVSR